MLILPKNGRLRTAEGNQDYQTNQEKVKTTKVSTTISLPKKEENKIKIVTLEMRNHLRIYKPRFWHRAEKTYYRPSFARSVLAI